MSEMYEREQPQAEQPQAEQPQAEQPQAEQPQTGLPLGEWDAESESLTDEDIREMELTDPAIISLLDSIDATRPGKADKVVVPELLDQDAGFTGAIYGFIRKDSGYHAILGWEGHMTAEEIDAQPIGAVCASREEADRLIAGAGDRDMLIGLRDESGALGFEWVRPAQEAVPLEKDIYTMRQNIFSRNSGLIETDWMDNKCVVLSGVGSVGSLVALQMARSGVGRFVLVDTDCMEIHNVCRHQCSLKDIGRYKVDAVAERIRQINPNAQVRVFYQRIQDVSPEKYRDWVENGNGLFIAACDNRVGDAFACDAAKEFNAPFVSLGFRDRAWAGELFVYLPQRGDICYRCAFQHQIEESIEEERRNHLYLDDSRQDVKIVPGLDVDIEYGVALLDKVALDILNIGNKAYTWRLLTKIGQYNYFSGSTDRSEGPFWEKMLPEPLSFRPIRLDDNMRRCERCLSTARR